MSITRFFNYYRPYKGLFALDFSCAVFAGILELTFPLAVHRFVDTLLPQKNVSLTVLACLGLLAIYSLNAFLNFVVTYWGHMLGINIETDMRRQLFTHLQKLSFRFYDNTKTGHLLSRMTNDLNEIGEVAHHGPEDVFIAFMTLIGAAALMIHMNPSLAGITLLIIPPMTWLAIYFNKKMTTTFRRLFDNLASFNARVEDNVGGIRVVQAFTNEHHERKLFARDNTNYRSTKLMAYKILAQSIAINYMLLRLVSVIVMIVGAFFVINDKLTYGEFIGFILLTNTFFRPIEKITAVLETYPKGIAGFKRFCELIDTSPEVADKPNAITVEHLRGDIRFENVTFGYTPQRLILTNLSLEIQAGQTVAFVGPSGAGKTTICSLLPRFYELNGGRITIDGLDITEMTLASLRSQIGVVQQDVFLFTGSLRENIAYGNLNASEQDIWEAARKAKLDEFIRNLPDGMDTLIGERGVKLSGGQKQRVSIARMFLKNPPILILDEATSALDSETERAIQQSLAELAVGRTTLVIAHRLATIRNADRIIMLTPEGIVEDGSHDDLMALNGRYSQLYRTQFSE